MKTLLRCLVILPALLASSVYANDLDFAHIETTGYGEVTAKPDMAEFSVQVEKLTKTSEQAKQSVDKVVSAFIEHLTAEGVSREDIVSGNLSLSPRYNYPKDGEQELVGFRASRRVTVSVYELDKLNGILDSALGDGINRVDNIRLKIRDQASYAEQARMAAIKDARAKARSLAKGFGMALNGIWSIRYNSVSPQPVLMRNMAAEAKIQGAGGYQDAAITIRDQVNVVYRIK
ncbi:oxidative stress defense protein [Vibrio albus]|uniref:Oxidative stress defense protein n=1 Tax=Vibrio albus TaxID=2200953 RepID=A0A2U3BCW6_9VIBR|nr:oxidative stress defense protein [Vibrio albus]PWI34639.1 oxidative stress defense protein [Vibrio albus]